MTTKPVRRRRRRRNSRHYFTQVHEDAIIQYCATTDFRTREELYVTYIQPAFNEMVDKIVYTYKFNNLPNIEELKDDLELLDRDITNYFYRMKAVKKLLKQLVKK